MYSDCMTSRTNSPRNACRLCGATNYLRLTHRGGNGAMVYSGFYRCSGCELTFDSPAAWREEARLHDSDSQVPSPKGQLVAKAQ